MSLFVFGLGYSAMHYVTTREADVRVSGTVRSRDKAQRIGAEQSNVEALVFDGADVEVDVENRLAQSTRLLISIAPQNGADPVLERFSDVIASAHELRRIIYLSTIGVYGDHGGAWIDEDTPTDPDSARNRARVAAEQGWRALAEQSGKQLTILRLAGIYGPGKNALVNLRDGKARRLVKPGQVFNRIHVEDIARAIEAAFRRDACSGTYNVTDDEPAPPQDVIAYAATLAGMEPPPELPFDGADLSPMARSFYSSNKRVSNSRLKQQLHVALAYPTFREGLRACRGEFPP